MALGLNGASIMSLKIYHHLISLLVSLGHLCAMTLCMIDYCRLLVVVSVNYTKDSLSTLSFNGVTSKSECDVNLLKPYN